MQDKCGGCLAEFDSKTEEGATIRRWSDSEYCRDCVNSCANATSEGHACSVCVDLFDVERA